MSISTSTHTPIQEFRPILKDLKLASSFCPYSFQIYLKDYQEIRDKYNLHKTVIRVHFITPKKEKFPGAFFAQDKDNIVILNILLHSNFFVKEDEINSDYSKRTTKHRKIIAVHEFVHTIANILARHNSLIDKEMVKNQIHSDIILDTLLSSLTLPDDSYTDSNACVDSIKGSDSDHFRYNSSDIAIDYEEVFKRLLLSKETISSIIDLDKIAKESVSLLNNKIELTNILKKLVEAIFEISNKKHIDEKMAKDRVLEEFSREVTLHLQKS